MDGVVTYAAALDEGTFIETDRSIATIADTNQLVLAYEVKNANEIMTGAQIQMRLNNRPDIYTGTVIQTPADVTSDATDVEKRYSFIKLDEEPDFVQMGGRALVRIILDSVQDVVALPNLYLTKTGDHYYIRVLVDGLPEEREVTVGVNNGSLYEITSGLEAGDEIVQ
jgi:macrolide-specific efflux system membrane fusion protein